MYEHIHYKGIKPQEVKGNIFAVCNIEYEIIGFELATNNFIVRVKRINNKTR